MLHAPALRYQRSAKTANVAELQKLPLSSVTQYPLPCTCSQSLYQSGLFHPVANASLYNSIYGSPSSAPGLPDTFITYTKETYADDPRYAGATCSGCAEWNEVCGGRAYAACAGACGAMLHVCLDKAQRATFESQWQAAVVVNFRSNAR